MSFASCFKRSFGHLLPITIHQFLVGPDLNSHDYKLVSRAQAEGDDDLPAAVGGRIEGLQQRRIFARRAINIQVGEHGCAVDGYIELTISGGAEIGFGKMQQDRVRTARRQPRNRVGGDSGSSVLIDSIGAALTPG
jgi:hypothetical protein